VLSGRVAEGQKTLFRMDARDRLPAGAAFRDRLEDCLLQLCQAADIPAPMWLAKNTAEIARFAKTSFLAEQFAERVAFDAFEIRITEY